MKIGYACLNIAVQNTSYKTCRIDNVTNERLAELISHNLCSLENTIDYNIKNNIKLFRITSDLIPFASSPVNKLDWTSIFKGQFEKIAKKVKDSNMRISMHAGQYTVLNSPKEEIVKKAVKDLSYHAKLLEGLKVGQKGKIVLHVGGVYGDKETAMTRFIENYKLLDPLVKKHLVIENDDKSYTVEDVLKISKQTGIPVVFDNLHNKINASNKEESEYYWIEKCKKTWRKEDGSQKIHYSQQDPEKKIGSHSKTIDGEEFLKFIERLENDDIDIMLEVKDKNLSTIKCKNIRTKNKNIKKLESEWGRYKYKVLETSHKAYLEIRTLLKDKTSYPALEFYKIIDTALETEATKGGMKNSATHIWGYFKNQVTEKEKLSFMKKMEKFEGDDSSIKPIKTNLLKLAFKYDEKYIIDSYYFYL